MLCESLLGRNMPQITSLSYGNRTCPTAIELEIFALQFSRIHYAGMLIKFNMFSFLLRISYILFVSNYASIFTSNYTSTTELIFQLLFSQKLGSIR